MKNFWRTAFRLGRVSNLPTVWTNVMAGVTLNGGEPRPSNVVPLGISVSLLYIAGMYLNDAFDRRWDAQHRPERPIPAGQVSAAAVFVAGFAMTGIGIFVLGAFFPSRGPLGAGVALAALIVIYDASHKTNPLAPLIMGLCRVGVYFTAALTVSGRIQTSLLAGSTLLLIYLVTLTLVARQETHNPKLLKLVGSLIAGISLVDGALLAGTGQWAAASICMGSFLLTHWLQRHVPGT